MLVGKVHGLRNDEQIQRYPEETRDKNLPGKEVIEDDYE
jgi:hypothetical protein